LVFPQVYCWQWNVLHCWGIVIVLRKPTVRSLVTVKASACALTMAMSIPSQKASIEGTTTWLNRRNSRVQVWQI
jgi:hypothetical protein